MLKKFFTRYATFFIFFTILTICLVFLFHITGSCESSRVYVIKISDDSINPITADYIINAIDKAESDNAQCLIIELDTPGGLLTSTRRIVKKILSSRIPVCVYVYPSGARAGSAGVFITYASHIAIMAPSTNIGAAHPVSMGGSRRSMWEALRQLIKAVSEKNEEEKRGSEKEPDKEKTEELPADADVLTGKILNDTIAFIKSIAEKRNRNIEWAEKSVRESASITEEEALKINAIDIIAEDENDLLNKLNGRTVKIDDKQTILNTEKVNLSYIEMNFRERLLNVLANPNIAYVLLLLGFYGLLYEFTHPGIGFPGIAGAICIILAFFSMQILPTNYAGLALIILAIILFIAEALAPGFGLLALGGVTSMILGSLILFESPYKMMRISLMLAISSSLATGGITVFLVGAVIKAHRRRIISGKEGLIGLIGEAKTNIYPDKKGKVFIHGEIWDATAKIKISKGDKIKVIKVQGLSLAVEPA